MEGPVALNLSRFLIAAGAVALLAGPAAARTGAPDFRLDEPFAGKQLLIKNLNGSIEVRRAPGSTLKVTATRTAERSDPNSVHVRVAHDALGIVICTIYPGQDDVCSRAGSSHGNSQRDNDTTVDFTVELPSGAGGKLLTVNGSIDANGLASPIDAMTVNGHVSVSTSSYAQAKTVNGAIHVAMGSPDWPFNRLDFASINGSIDVSVPNSASAHVHMKTLNGSIHSNVSLSTTQGLFGITHAADGVIGAGRGELTFTTVNGSIALERTP